jgi:hypothetical protein
MTAAPMAWVLYYDGRSCGHGSDMSAHASYQLARAALARIARSLWRDLNHQPGRPPPAVFSLTDDQIIDQYFAAAADEHWTIAHLVIDGHPDLLAEDLAALARSVEALGLPNWSQVMLAVPPGDQPAAARACATRCETDLSTGAWPGYTDLPAALQHWADTATAARMPAPTS